MGIAAVAIAAVGVLMFARLGSRGGGASTTVAAANIAPARRPVASAPVVTQTWSTTRRGYWTANQRHAAAFELPAENTVALGMNYVRPSLVVRCMAKHTEAFVYTGSALKIEPETEDHTVSFRFDDEPATTERWPDSAEHDALFAPDAVRFAERIMHARTLRFGYTPHNASTVEAQFSVSGLTPQIEPAAKDCGWQK